MDEISETRVLVEAAQQGDRVALDQVCARYQERVLQIVRLRLGPKLRAKVESWDIVQDALIDAVRKLDSFEFPTEDALFNFLNRVVENRIRDEAGRWDAQKRRPDREVSLQGKLPVDTSMAFDPGGAEPTPSRVVSLREELTQLEAAIERLPDDYREVIIATKLEGRSYQDLAEESQKSIDSVRMQANRAMRMLNREFRSLAGGPE